MNPYLEADLKALNLSTFLNLYLSEAEQALIHKATYVDYLSSLASREVQSKDNLLLKRRLQEARFPLTKTLDSFDFNRIKSLSKESVYALSDGAFTQQAQNIIFFGPCGTGKSHLALALGRELCLKKFRVSFQNVASFVERLQMAHQNHALDRFMKRFFKFDLIILDELGYIPMKPLSAMVLFQFIAACYEIKSLLITTNLAFSQWDQVFKDKQTAGAACDRLIHHSYLFKFIASSFRLNTRIDDQREKVIQHGESYV